MPDMLSNFLESLRQEYGRYFCRRCADLHIRREAEERFSMGIYAGMYCDNCWAVDGRNHKRRFDPMDAGESYDDKY